LIGAERGLDARLEKLYEVHVDDAGCDLALGKRQLCGGVEGRNKFETTEMKWDLTRE
jgi:hypothetical protein